MASADAARHLLAGAGFVEIRGRAFESNVVYDTPLAELRETRRLLRLREFDGEALVTFKGPPVKGRHKSREEIETNVESAERFHAILTRLGYRVEFKYEKYRTTYARKGDHAGVAVLDETPIGVYLELEGPPEWIDGAAKVLGVPADKYINDSYVALYFKYCEAHGLNPGNMVFAA